MRAFRPQVPAARRLLFFVLVALTVALASAALFEILSANGVEPIEVAILVLFVVNFVWIALSFWTAVAGFALRMLGREPINLMPADRLRQPSPLPISTRTAVAIPVYNEDPHRVFAGLEAMYLALADAGGIDHFQFFVLSDTTRDEIAAVERRYFDDFRRRHAADNRVFYRRREQNLGRKAGNIADFLSRWGAAYDYLVVLDADSVMSGATLVQLVRLMQGNPDAGMIQTAPVPFRQKTLFGRALQFTSRLVGPVLSSGASFWQLRESNYWGHNAILRTRAFIENCGLPHLPGRPPLGGEILSHDYVEAALLRRGGWLVYFVPDLQGSYEELPSNILDYATRDRRWCQGNLQHLRLLRVRGIHWINRFYFISGAFSYLSSPLWVALLLLSTAAVVEEAITGPEYFAEGYQLFPDWPISKLSETLSLFAVTMAMLFLPKVLGLIVALTDGAELRRWGGGWAVTAGLLLETLFSMLIAPVMGGLHSYFVLSLLFGRAVGWNPQSRADRGLGIGEAASSLGLLFAFGIVWLAVLMSQAPDYLWWMLPVLAGLLLAVPISVLSSRRSVGLGLGERRLLLTPEEVDPPPELVALTRALDRAPLSPRTPEPMVDESAMPPVRWTPMPAQKLPPLVAEPASVATGASVEERR
jgi:membrane glycosyltransferase